LPNEISTWELEFERRKAAQLGLEIIDPSTEYAIAPGPSDIGKIEIEIPAY